MAWYFTNASGDFLASTLSNWNSAPDGSGDTPTYIPWVTGHYGDDLVYTGTGLSDGGYSILFDGLSISSSVTGTCDIPTIAFITDGTSTIAGGTFTGYGLVFQGCLISAGIFLGSSITLSECIISGGIFGGGGITAYSTSITGGTLEVSGFSNVGSSIAANITLTEEGSFFTGTFNGYNYVDGVYVSPPPPPPPPKPDGWDAATSSYYLGGVATTLPQSGTGFWSGTYYLGGVATALQPSGTGYWVGTYYIGGTATTLPSSGTGLWNGSYYLYGVLTPPPTNGWHVPSSTYYIAGAASTLPQSGTGAWSGTYYIGGSATTLSVDGTGSWSGSYYISGSVTTLSSDGTGSYQNKYYIGGTATTLTSGGTGSFWGTYYVSGTATTLPPSGTGNFNGTYHIAGSPTPLDSTGSGTWNGTSYQNGEATAQWHHFPRQLGFITEFLGRPYEPGYPINVYLSVQGPPDGAAPTFPSGSNLELWYYRISHGAYIGRSAPLFQDETGAWSQWSFQGNEYVGDNGFDLEKVGPEIVSIGSLTWTQVDAETRTWKSSLVLAMSGYEWDGGWTFTDAYSTGEPNTEFYTYYPAEINADGPIRYSEGPFTNLSNGSVSAIAASSSAENWKRFPTGYLTYGSNNYLGILGLVSVKRKGIDEWYNDIGNGTVDKTPRHSDFLSGGNWYVGASVTESTADGYNVGDGIDPYVRPTGFKLTAQTATSRTWTKDESQAFTITLSIQFNFEEWKEAQYPEMYLASEPDPNNPPPPEKDRRWFDATDCGDFVISRVGDPATGTTELSGLQGMPLRDGDTDSHWRLTCGTVSGDGTVADIPAEIGSATIYCWNKDDGITEKTVTFHKESCYMGGKDLIYDIGTLMIWRSTSFGEENYPVAIKSLSGQIATGYAEGTGLYPINNLRGDDPIYPRIPVPE